MKIRLEIDERHPGGFRLTDAATGTDVGASAFALRADRNAGLPPTLTISTINVAATVDIEAETEAEAEIPPPSSPEQTEA